MWRMRLLFGFVVLLALGHLPQERGVLAQKYYMNFAFNNNNPAGDGSNANPPPDGQVHENISDGINGNIENNHNGNDNTGDMGGDGSGGGEPHGDGNEGAGEDVDAAGTSTGYNGEDKDGNDNGNENGNENGNDNEILNDAQQARGGEDDDTDDSDSKDKENRRQKQEALKRNAHSHHSSYEISIDDSFGGRYVRSIYESSESHGHSGSRDDSNARDKGHRESSQEGMDRDHEDDDNTKNNADYTEIPAAAVEVPDVTEGAGLARGGYNADYEEM